MCSSCHNFPNDFDSVNNEVQKRKLISTPRASCFIPVIRSSEVFWISLAFIHNAKVQWCSSKDIATETWLEYFCTRIFFKTQEIDSFENKPIISDMIFLWCGDITTVFFPRLFGMMTKCKLHDDWKNCLDYLDVYTPRKASIYLIWKGQFNFLGNPTAP